MAAFIQSVDLSLALLLFVMGFRQASSAVSVFGILVTGFNLLAYLEWHTEQTTCQLCTCGISLEERKHFTARG